MFKIIMSSLLVVSSFCILTAIEKSMNKIQLQTNNLMVKKATEQDFPLLHTILVTCGKYMYENMGLNHWYPYADLAKFKEKVKHADVYCVWAGDQIIATFSLNRNARDYYRASMWHNSEDVAVYLGNLAILPEFQSKGIGSYCLWQAEVIAQEMGCTAIRLDCIERHPWLATFYEKAAYQKRCTVTLSEPTGVLVCFEKRCKMHSQSSELQRFCFLIANKIFLLFLFL